MLRTFRENLKHLAWVLPVVIAVFIGFFMTDFLGTAPGGVVGTRNTAATVGGEEITFSQFQRAYEAQEANLKRLYGDGFTRETARQMGLPMQVMNELIARKILTAEAERAGLAVTDGELREAILEQPVFKDADGRFVGEEVYRRILRQNGYTPESFESTLRRDLQSEKLQRILADSVYVSEAEVEQAYREQVERAEIRYLKLSAARFAGEVTLGPAEIESYFADRREEFRLPEKRRVSYLLVDPAALEPTVAVGDEEIRAYYEEHRDDYTREERVRARHILLRVADEAAAPAVEQRLRAIRGRIEAGEPFADLAAELSEDPGSREGGGDLGFFGRGDMIGAFEDAAFGARPGELVGPVRTSFGYHLIEVLDRQAGGSRSLDEVRDEIHATLVAERAATLAERRAGELASQARRERPAEAEAFAELGAGEPGVVFEQPPPFARDEMVPGVGRATPFSSAAFELEPGETSEPIRVTGGWAVLRLDDVEPPRLPALDEVRGQVEAAARAREQLRLARRRLEEARLAIEAGSTLDEAAAGLGVEVVDSGPFGRDGLISALGRQPALAAAALAAEPGEIGGPIDVDGDPLLFEVVERQRFDPQLYAAARDQTRDQLEQERYAMLVGSLIERRREELDITLDPDFTANFVNPTDAT